MLKILLRKPNEQNLAKKKRGDIVYASYDESWWMGQFLKMERNAYVVYFDNTWEIGQHRFAFTREQLRIYQEWRSPKPT